MAQKRMFSLKIIDTDLFLDMPISTQLLYFHLSMRADDDGFVSNPKKITKMVNCSDDDLKILTMKKFIIPFESGVCVIKHWKIHNYIQKDRYDETQYLQEKSQIMQLENGTYEIMDTKCIQDVSEMETQIRLDKNRVDKVSKDKINIIDAYTSNVDLIQAIKDFKEMRTKNKKPFTDRALKMMLTELDKLAQTDELKIKILEQSIFYGWKGVFALSKDKAQQQSNNTQQQQKNTQPTGSKREYQPGQLEKMVFGR